jgi:hypothetical protein
VIHQQLYHFIIVLVLHFNFFDLFSRYLQDVTNNVNFL